MQPRVSSSLAYLTDVPITYPRYPTEAVARHMRGEGINTMVKFLQDKGARQYRLYVLQLLSVLSMHIGPDVAGAFRSEHQLAVLKELLMESDKVPLREQTLAATILANLPLTEFEVGNHFITNSSQM